MSERVRDRAALLAATIVAALGLPCGQAAADSAVPFSSSAYSVAAACRPPAPGRATCFALRLLAGSRQAGAERSAPALDGAPAPSAAPSPRAGEVGYTPRELHAAYELQTGAPATQTIALVDAYNDLNIETDLAKFDKEFKLPECTEANGCFRKVNESGDGPPSEMPFPATTQALSEAEAACEAGDPEECELVEEVEGWTVEISLDVETAHSICQENCRVTLVEGDSSLFTDLDAAEETAARLGATEISNSWGGPECTQRFGCVSESRAFEHPGTVIAASAGDDGYLDWDAEHSEERGHADYPASSPRVVAVGGTRLSAPGGVWENETVWNGDGAGGGGCSELFTAQPWQQAVSDWSSLGCGTHRAVADVSADADPYTGVAVRDSSPACEFPYQETQGGEVKHLEDWCTIGGTSLASPIVAATFALAGGAGGVAYPSRTLYENETRKSASLHDVTQGSNARCAKPYDFETGLSGCSAFAEGENCTERAICVAGRGYDGPTGVGTPHGIGAFEPTGVGNEEPGASPAAPQGPAPTTGASPLPNPGGGSAAPLATTVQLSDLALTLHALIALNRPRPTLAALSFTFTLNLAARVHATLSLRSGRRGHRYWKTVARLATIAARAGRDENHLSGRTALRAGTYRLTLTPAGGAARSITFKLG